MDESPVQDVSVSDMRPHRAGHRLARLLLIPLVAAFAIIIIVFYVLFDFVSIEGDSMNPTLLSGDRIFVTKTYEYQRRGDIVVTKQGVAAFGGEGIVKRVIAIQGDTVSVSGDVVYVNGVREPDIPLIRDPSSPAQVEGFKIPEGYVFLVGDNRPISLDSRFEGAVSESVIDGRAVAIWAPIGRIRILEQR